MDDPDGFAVQNGLLLCVKAPGWTHHSLSTFFNESRDHKTGIKTFEQAFGINAACFSVTVK